MIRPTINLPTALTLSRIVVIPFFIWITPSHPISGAIVFSMASLTDYFDGYLARRSGQITNFGIILDPIADKFLVISALIMLVSIGTLSVWPAVIIIVREFLVTALRAAALSKNIVIQAEMGGKLKVGAQITGIICLIVEDSLLAAYFDSYLGVDLYAVGIVAIWISIVLAVASAIQYTFIFWKKMV